MKCKSKLFFSAGLVIIMTIFLMTSLAYANEEIGVIEQERAAQEEAKLFKEGGPIWPDSLYAKDVEHLKNLHLLPAGKMDWSAETTWATFLEILNNLDARKAGIVPGLDNWVATDSPLTYADAVKVLLPILNYRADGDVETVQLAQSLGIGIEANSIYDNLTGEELAHLIYQTLSQKPAKEKDKKAETTIMQQVFMIQAAGALPVRKVLEKTSTTIEVEYEGQFTLASGVTVFDDVTGEPLSMSNVVVGMTGAYLVLDSNNLVTSIGITQKYVPNKIRVLISSALSSTGASTSYDFTQIQLLANNTVYVRTKTTTGLKTIATVKRNTTFTLTCSGSNVYYNGALAGSRVFVESDSVSTLITVKSTTRGGVNPSYEGNMEIVPSTTAGKLWLINDLPMENYLYKVVPSEMPASWHVEALKCQSVAARSYAVNQSYGTGYTAKSANVDDSTNCQVYNNTSTTQGVIDAVNATRGEVMTYNGSVVTAYFCSTSAGYTADNEDVWHNSATGAFPGDPLPYTRAKAQIPGYAFPSFTTDEVGTLNYYKAVPTNGFDYAAAWYRWNVNLTRVELEKTISKNLPLREAADQTLGIDCIQTISGAYPTPNSTTFTIGTLLDLRVIQRGDGGNMMILEIVGTNGTWRVLKEYNIRFVIKPNRTDCSATRDILIYCHTGTTYTNYSILPSAFASFEIHKSGADITDVTFYGGGNGHGVGMSQYGAKGYADKGYLYQTILGNFYTGIAYTVLY